jgi:pimeloyl-ACP methyl ester carboxylesterase
MQQVLKQDGEFTYIEEGSGPTLLVLHGLFGALSNFRDVLDEFRHNFRVVIPMMPIYELPVEDTHVRSLAAFILRFVQFKGYSSLNLLGNSLGGHVALVFSKDHPELVNSLILTGSSGLYENAMGGSFPRREDYDFIQKKVTYPWMQVRDTVDATTWQQLMQVQNTLHTWAGQNQEWAGQNQESTQIRPPKMLLGHHCTCANAMPWQACRYILWIICYGQGWHT